MPSEKECHLFVAGVDDDRNPIAMNEELGVITNCFKGKLSTRSKKDFTGERLAA